MPSLASCPSCSGFIVDVERACPHCGAAPRPRRTLARYLALQVFGAAATVTLMACYGGGAYYDCYDAGTCGCTDDAECSIGTYCDTPYDGGVGTCTWSGECWGPDQCAGGFTCDYDRQTCVPGCAEDSECYSGEVCDLATSTCVPGEYCLYDGAVCGVGERCDPYQGVCVPCAGAECGSCSEEATCGYSPPACPEGTIAAVEDGCYNASCIEVAVCLAAECTPLDEPACLASDTCAPTYVGIDCTDPDGAPCTETTAMCTCESFELAGCVPDPP
jgi:hypothetical protein